MHTLRWIRSPGAAQGGSEKASLHGAPTREDDDEQDRLAPAEAHAGAEWPADRPRRADRESARRARQTERVVLEARGTKARSVATPTTYDEKS